MRPRLGLGSLAMAILLAACTRGGGGVVGTPAASRAPTSTRATPAPTATPCPQAIRRAARASITPGDLRAAYGVEPLIEHGDDGAGQTVIDVVSYGSPTLQRDLDVFDQRFGLPSTTVQVVAPLGTRPDRPGNRDIAGWAGETELDVELIHAIAPGASIVVMTSPVDETEGTLGLPEFLQLEQYAVDHDLGHIFSQSWTASEATLGDAAGRALVARFAAFYQQIVTQQGDTVVNASGDNGATDLADVCATRLATTATIGFPADVPWVTTVGGTTLRAAGGGYDESAWPSSGGGMSAFFGEPDFQLGLPASAQATLAGRRGIPDVAADADPATSMLVYINGQWGQVGGTSASAPVWAAIFAIADQMAGRPLGFVNPALYALGRSPGAGRDFRDITTGDNGVHEGGVDVPGYRAEPGWDAVTGWGAPLASGLIPDLIAAQATAPVSPA